MRSISENVFLFQPSSLTITLVLLLLSLCGGLPDYLTPNPPFSLQAHSFTCNDPALFCSHGCRSRCLHLIIAHHMLAAGTCNNRVLTKYPDVVCSRNWRNSSSPCDDGNNRLSDRHRGLKRPVHPPVSVSTVFANLPRARQTGYTTSAKPIFLVSMASITLPINSKLSISYYSRDQ